MDGRAVLVWLVEPLLPYSCQIRSTTVTGRPNETNGIFSTGRTRCWRMLLAPFLGRMRRPDRRPLWKQNASSEHPGRLWNRAQALIADEKIQFVVHSSAHTASAGHL